MHSGSNEEAMQECQFSFPRTKRWWRRAALRLSVSHLLSKGSKHSALEPIMPIANLSYSGSVKLQPLKIIAISVIFWVYSKIIWTSLWSDLMRKCQISMVTFLFFEATGIHRLIVLPRKCQHVCSFPWFLHLIWSDLNCRSSQSQRSGDGALLLTPCTVCCMTKKLYQLSLN